MAVGLMLLVMAATRFLSNSYGFEPIREFSSIGATASSIGNLDVLPQHRCKQASSPLPAPFTSLPLRVEKCSPAFPHSHGNMTTGAPATASLAFPHWHGNMTTGAPAAFHGSSPWENNTPTDHIWGGGTSIGNGTLSRTQRFSWSNPPVTYQTRY